MSTQSRRLKWNLLLLAMVILLVAFAMWVIQRDNAQVKTISSLQPQAVHTILIERNLGQTPLDVLEIKREGEQWYLTKPQRQLVGKAQMAQVLSLLTEPVGRAYRAVEQDLASFALDIGYVRVRFNDEVFVLGAENRVSNKRYILHNGKIHLVSEMAFGLLNSPASAWHEAM